MLGGSWAPQVVQEQGWWEAVLAQCEEATAGASLWPGATVLIRLLCSQRTSIAWRVAPSVGAHPVCLPLLRLWFLVGSQLA